MVNIQKSGDSAIKFTFTDNDRYLYDGEITVPLNSLILVFDESDMVVIKKVDGDVFLTFLIDNTNFTSKAELEEWFKENACGSTGGGGGVTSGEVQTMIDESISGKADASDVQEIASDVATVSGDVNTLSGSVNALTGAVNTLSGDVSTLSGSVDSNHNAITALNGDVQTLSGQVQGDETILTGHTANTDIHVTASDKQNWNNKSDFSGDYNDLTNKPTIPTVPTNVSDFVNDAGYATSGYVDSSVSGKVNTTDFNTYSASTDARLVEDEEVTSAALNELNDALDDKADTTAVTASISAAVSGKQDTLVSGTNIKTINNESLLGSGNIDIQGGGKAIEAGRGISVTTGATADTVSFNLPISAGTGNGSVIMGKPTKVNASGNYSFAGGENSSATTFWAFSYGAAVKADGQSTVAFGYQCYANRGQNFICGGFNRTNNESEFGCGQYNNSVSASTTFGDSGNTLFSVGNGTANNARHNALEIRQNGDIYITSGGTDIKLQDNLGGGGGGVPESAFTAYTAATDARLAEDEEVTAAALNTLSTAMGGLKLVQLTQAQYDALATKDASTLYIITGSN